MFPASSSLAQSFNTLIQRECRATVPEAMGFPALTHDAAQSSRNAAALEGLEDGDPGEQGDAQDQQRPENDGYAVIQDGAEFFGFLALLGGDQ